MTRNEAAGYRGWQELGENIAADYTIAAALQGWTDSPPHCKTLMDPGTGKGNSARAMFASRAPVCQQRTHYGTSWTQEFGTR